MNDNKITFFDEMKYMPEEITSTFKKTNLIHVYGEAHVTTWDDIAGTICMHPYTIDVSCLTSEEAIAERILKEANDGGFGSQSIDGVYASICQVYTSNDGRELYKHICNADVKLNHKTDKIDFIFE